MPTDHTFTGQKLDESTGLMYYGARYYDVALGRFIQPDTLVSHPRNPQAWNRYSYVLNNPLYYVDPTGHQVKAAAGVIMIVAEAANPAPLDPLVIPAAVNLIVSDPWVQQTLSWVSMHSDKLPAVADRLFRFAQDIGGRIQQAFQGGDAASSGGLDPNDPWSRFTELVSQGKSEIDAAVEASTRGSGNRFVIGKYVSPEKFQATGEVGYIQEVQLRGGKYFDTGRSLLAKLEGKGLTEAVNREVIYRQMQAGIRRIELAGEIIDDVMEFRGNSWTAKEITWIREFAELFGYVEDATGWTKMVQ